MADTDRPAPQLGLAFVPTLAPERLRTLAPAVEAVGLDELWVWEDCFKQSGVASAAAALAWTTRLRVGIGLLPVPLRNVALTAMELATLERMFPGRLVPGVGHGVQAWMAQVGVRPASPLTLLREYATALRALLAGERVSVEGRYVQLDDVALDWPPAPPPPLMLGGSGPRSLELTAELGDGTLLAAALTVEQVADVGALLARTRGAGHPLVATVIVATGADAQQRVDAEVPLWGGEPGRGIGVAGDAARVAAEVRAFADAGATSVVFQPVGGEPDLDGWLGFLGGEVAPLVRG
ncbi:LLM class flavin-dependent oxidoreductase [Microlunatus capsulatus]|uniref:Alkanesulfonate monooxygenase SsuD/methylene tetrahydromethanopterin reductase-like flavin-dependent oxidoreductase (Luciferase family) n=1 Tax=Microlunatus capsulatus TaxID=99117 RepID=A0ABS4Z7S5_9ACTN|nr:LLM class flavin-dependent oxidoreductase [Microlunatus capsulatus]MBP2417083.1 alkanesulfonate monooxygenase SsuD/methylene tetrahydromethanopterin reductase-like flavin-dependent oxidoreductase (luciferase family) [Microlunatus capsulatus]